MNQLISNIVIISPIKTWNLFSSVYLYVLGHTHTYMLIRPDAGGSLNCQAREFGQRELTLPQFWVLLGSGFIVVVSQRLRDWIWALGSETWNPGPGHPMVCYQCRFNRTYKQPRGMPCINVPKLDKHGANAIERLRHAHTKAEKAAKAKIGGAEGLWRRGPTHLEPNLKLKLSTRWSHLVDLRCRPPLQGVYLSFLWPSFILIPFLISAPPAGLIWIDCSPLFPLSSSISLPAAGWLALLIFLQLVTPYRRTNFRFDNKADFV